MCAWSGAPCQHHAIETSWIANEIRSWSTLCRLSKNKVCHYCYYVGCIIVAKHIFINRTHSIFLHFRYVLIISNDQHDHLYKISHFKPMHYGKYYTVEYFHWVHFSLFHQFQSSSTSELIPFIHFRYVFIISNNQNDHLYKISHFKTMHYGKHDTVEYFHWVHFSLFHQFLSDFSIFIFTIQKTH